MSLEKISSAKHDIIKAFSLLCTEKIIQTTKIRTNNALQFVQSSFHAVTEDLQNTGISGMMNSFTVRHRIKALELSKLLKELLYPLYFEQIKRGQKNNIDTKSILKRFSSWEKNFQKAQWQNSILTKKEYFDQSVLLVSFVKFLIESTFEIMQENGMSEENSFTESIKPITLENTPIFSHSNTQAYLNKLENFIFQLDANMLGQSFQETADIKPISYYHIKAIDEEISNLPIEIVRNKLKKNKML